jgi:hypothetical protein
MPIIFAEAFCGVTAINAMTIAAAHVQMLRISLTPNLSCWEPTQHYLTFRSDSPRCFSQLNVGSLTIAITPSTGSELTAKRFAESRT